MALAMCTEVEGAQVVGRCRLRRRSTHLLIGYNVRMSMILCSFSSAT